MEISFTILWFYVEYYYFKYIVSHERNIDKPTLLQPVSMCVECSKILIGGCGDDLLCEPVALFIS